MSDPAAFVVCARHLFDYIVVPEIGELEIAISDVGRFVAGLTDSPS
jgi:hypothetical protein